MALTTSLTSGTLGQRQFDALTLIADTILDDPALPRTRSGVPGVVLLADLGALCRLATDGDIGQSVPAATTGRPVELAQDGPITDALATELLAHRDYNHVIRWPQGPTCECNLVPLCRYHHRLKTHTRWRIALRPDRGVEWPTPHGRAITVYPDEDDEAA